MARLVSFSPRATREKERERERKRYSSATILLEFIRDRERALNNTISLVFSTGKGKKELILLQSLRSSFKIVTTENLID